MLNRWSLMMAKILTCICLLVLTIGCRSASEISTNQELYSAGAIAVTEGHRKHLTAVLATVQHPIEDVNIATHIGVALANAEAQRKLQLSPFRRQKSKAILSGDRWRDRWRWSGTTVVGHHTVSATVRFSKDGSWAEVGIWMNSIPIKTRLLEPSRIRTREIRP